MVAAERWRGLAVYGVDGTTLRAPDTAQNEAAFGRVPTRWESTGGYPVMRVVALMVLRRHVLTARALGAYRDERRCETWKQATSYCETARALPLASDGVRNSGWGETDRAAREPGRFGARLPARCGWSGCLAYAPLPDRLPFR